MRHRFILNLVVRVDTMIQQQVATEQIRPLPETLNSPQAKLVYLYLEAAGGATVCDLNEMLVMKKIDILSVLNSLSSEDLVEKDGRHYVTAN